MTQPNPSTALARVVVDELARGGVELIVISPGSRSAAIAIAAAEHPGIVTRVVTDERSAAFWALGRAKASGRPAAVVSTSGTAPANHFPAVVEADMALVPLVVVSADRPAELRGVGANQTIDQVGLFGPKVRASSHIEAPGSDRDLNDAWRRAVSSLAAAAMGSRGTPGPVHLNVAFREPTAPVADDGRSIADPYPYEVAGREGGTPWVDAEPPSPPPGRLVVPPSTRGLVIAGEGAYDAVAASRLADAAGWPVLATSMSGARGAGAVTTYHHLLAGGVPERLRPDVVVAIGAVGPSRRLEELVASARLRFRVDPMGRTIDPGRNATATAHADPLSVLATLQGDGPGSPWAASWASADTRARELMDEHLAGPGRRSGAAAARAIDAVGWDLLAAASSLPIREVDAHVTRRGRVIGNRGASGIDGFVSTALGAASAASRTLALAGDLSLLHDSNGFLCEEPGDLTMVVLDNDGGGLFDSLPHAAHAPLFDRLFIAPHGRSLRRLAELHGVGFDEDADAGELAGIADARLDEPGLHLIRVPIERGRDLEVREALDALGAGAATSAET